MFMAKKEETTKFDLAGMKVFIMQIVEGGESM